MGLDVFYVDDAISSYSDELKKISRKSLRDMVAVIVNTDLDIFELAVDSKDPNFKFVSNLLK